ncbi:MAG: PEP-CTERM sorting domain-containing protein [Burkholderiales bacterium PBB5]|nr:MAG: PEP-CTERM sorting domain-containing protein [Burkholderiales bacterium PBB5]
MTHVSRRLRPVALGLLSLCAAAVTHAADVKITFTNLAPAGGAGVAPLWVGLHNSSFDAFDAGSAATLGIERAAEDGNASQLSAIFAASVSGGVQGVLPGPPAFPGAVRSLTLANADLGGANRYFSYAAMVVVSNDFFIGNDDAKAFDLSGLAAGGKLSLLVGGPGQVWDAGTEVNDFNHSLANGAFGIGGGQSSANEGADELGVVHLVTGNPYTSFLGQSLVPAGYNWGALDFNAGAAFGRIDIEVSAAPVPEPDSYALMLAGLVGVAVLARRRGMAPTRR